MLFNTLEQRWYWPCLRIDCYAIARACPECANVRVKLRKHSSELKIFPAAQPLQVAAVDVLGKLPRAPRGKKYLLLVWDRLSKLTCTLPLRSIAAEAIAQAFVSR